MRAGDLAGEAELRAPGPSAIARLWRFSEDIIPFYRGNPAGGRFVVTVLDDRGQVRSLDPRLDIRNHSPDGFAWGYPGSGPARLALAILCDALGDDERATQL